MYKTAVLLIALLFATIVSACALFQREPEYEWKQIGSAPSDYEVASYECQREVLMALPTPPAPMPSFTPATPSPTYTYRGLAGARDVLVPDLGRGIAGMGASLQQSALALHHAEMQEAMFVRCMKVRGWDRVRAK